MDKTAVERIEPIRSRAESGRSPFPLTSNPHSPRNMQIHTRSTTPLGPAATEELPILYFKPGCPWCNEAIAFLDEHCIPCRRIDVTRDSAGLMRLTQISPHAKVPTLDWHGEILADFGLDELVPFLRSKNLRLEGV